MNLTAVVGGFAILVSGVLLLATGKDTTTGAALALAGAAELGAKGLLKGA